ncbi:MAG: hypothetical protein ACI9TH_001594 [Kiritimatiellia bacterium]|jgi:hypothetical protein
MHFGLEVRRFCAFMSKRRASPILAADVLYLFFAFAGLMSFGGAVGAFSPAPHFFGYTTCQTLTVLAVYSPVVIACIWWIYRPGVKSFLPFSGFIGKISENIRVLFFWLFPPSGWYAWGVTPNTWPMPIARSVFRLVLLNERKSEISPRRKALKLHGIDTCCSSSRTTSQPRPCWRRRLNPSPLAECYGHTGYKNHPFAPVAWSTAPWSCRRIRYLPLVPRSQRGTGNA